MSVHSAVSVIIPTWNGRDLLDVCLPFLQAQTLRDFETIVVDNGSTDGTVAWLRTAYPRIHVIAFSENRGFAAAANAGIAAAYGDVLVLLNNDTEPDPHWLEELVDALRRHPEVGFCASRILNYYDRSRIDSAGDRLGLLADQIGHGSEDGPAFSRSRAVLSACAAAAAYRREVIDKIGFFDERFISYLEDVDLGVRAQYAGYSCLYVPEAVIYHMVSATAQRLNYTKLRLLLRNSLFLFWQYMPPRVLLKWGAVMLVWPFVHVVRTGAPVTIALQAMAGFLRALPSVLRRRRAVRGSRMITDSALLQLLSPPVGFAPDITASGVRETMS